MRVLLTIPHYFAPDGPAAGDARQHGSLARDPEPRRRALTACLLALHRLYGGPHCVIDIARRTTRPANQAAAHHLDVVVCTTGTGHLLDSLPVPGGLYRHQPTAAPPPLLGYECQAVLRDQLGRYEYYGYLEDDLVAHDPGLFVKLAWFNRHVGDHRLLQPNRFEAGCHPLVRKAYVDGDLAGSVLERFSLPRETRRLSGRAMGVPVRFEPARNPHAGCYFLNARQMETWARQPHFLDRAASFVGPLESSATLGLVRTFSVYKPAAENADFLEIEHFGTAFLDRIRPAPEGQNP